MTTATTDIPTETTWYTLPFTVRTPTLAQATMEREVTHGESNESSRLLQQLLEERRRRLEKRLADETFTFLGAPLAS